MKIISVYPNEIIIQENLERYISEIHDRFDIYINKNEHDKCVVTYSYSGNLIALDGNKLCAVNRILNKKVMSIYLENEEDFNNFPLLYDTDIYESGLINFKKWQNLAGELDLFIKMHHNIDKKDFFTGDLRNQNKFFDFLNLYYSKSYSYRDIGYKGMTEKTKRIVGIKY